MQWPDAARWLLQEAGGAVWEPKPSRFHDIQELVVVCPRLNLNTTLTQRGELTFTLDFQETYDEQINLTTILINPIKF